MRHLLLPLVLFLISCSSTLPSINTYKMDIQQGNVVTPKMMLQLKPGMSKSQVRFVLGTPLLADSFHRDRWDYFYEMNKGGKVVERRRVILEFSNETLKSVRGDIIPAGQPGAENAPIASVKEIRSARSNKELLEEDAKKPWWERFKFWGDDAIDLTMHDQKVDASGKTTTSQSNSNQQVVVKPEPAQTQPDKAATTSPVAATAIPAEPEKSTAQPSKTTNASAKPVATAAASKEAAAPAPVEGTVAAQVANQVKRWNMAWQARKLNDYLNLYSANFVPEGLGRRAWLEQQQQKFGSAEYIEDIQIENLQVEVHGSIATAQFDQISTTPAGINKVSKEVNFENEGGLWRIVRETVKTQFAPLPAQAVPNKDGVILHERSEAPPEYPQNAPAKSDASGNQDAKSSAASSPSSSNTSTNSADSKKTDTKKTNSNKAKKDVPLPPEDEPGYFEKLLEKIGF